ncbi:MAG TPA: YitT family protein [Candidatus Onthousia faecavium]|nr:YitT family protein [Candidatus Onthousia faecavium]
MKEKLWYRYGVLLASLFLSALVFNLFLYPTNLVTGGMNGVAIIINHIIEIDPAIVIFVGSLLLLGLSYLFLGLDQTAGSVVATIVYPVFVEITEPLSKLIVIDTSDLILMSILIGVLLGITNGLMYKVGFSNGGLNIISQIFYKYFRISLSKTTMVINLIVVLIGGFYFGFNMVLYALVIIYISSFVIDKVILGISNNKAFYITTTEDEKVRDYLINTLHHTVTIFDVKGGFLEKKRRVLLAVIPTRDYFRLKEGIKEIDPHAFFVVTDAYEVKGGK